MSEPRLGMNYENVRARVKRMAGYTGRECNRQLKSNMVNSLLNQAELKDRGARRELEKELRHYSR